MILIHNSVIIKTHLYYTAKKKTKQNKDEENVMGSPV